MLRWLSSGNLCHWAKPFSPHKCQSFGRPAHSCHPPGHSPDQDAWRKALSDLDSVSLLSPPYLPTPLHLRLSRQIIWLTYNMTWLQPKSYRKNLNTTLKHSGSLCLMWKKSTSQDLYDTPRQEPTIHPEKIWTAHHPNILHCPWSMLSGCLGPPLQPPAHLPPSLPHSILKQLSTWFPILHKIDLMGEEPI